MLVAFINYLILDKTLNDMHEFEYQRTFKEIIVII